MGYTTDFYGHFQVTPTLSESHAAYLSKFADTRRMKRLEGACVELADPVREAVGLPVGVQGAYFTGSESVDGQDFDHSSVMDHNRPPKGQPGLWCQWVPSADRTAITWDGGEKFYYYVEWLEYLIQNFLEPWGYTLNGSVKWCGEEDDDRGTIVCTDNAVETREASIVW
jgi:hypothetical protein